jgi:hypothetical protein
VCAHQVYIGTHEGGIKKVNCGVQDSGPVKSYKLTARTLTMINFMITSMESPHAVCEIKIALEVIGFGSEFRGEIEYDCNLSKL